jgi:large conductance mechanosensitive channel
MFQGFKKFILKGNVVDLAVGVVIGVAFNSVIASLVKDIITPLIGTIGGSPDFSKLSFTFRGSQFLIGEFVNTLVSFIIVSTVIYFFVVVPMNKLSATMNKGKSELPTEKICPECLSSIPLQAKKCKFCTSVQLKK